MLVADSLVDKEQIAEMPPGRIGDRRYVVYHPEPYQVEEVCMLVPGRVDSQLVEHAPVDTPHPVAGTLMAVGTVYRAVVGTAHREIVAGYVRKADNRVRQ